MEIVIVVFVSLTALLMIGIGIWSIWDARRIKPNLPLLFAWAQGANKAAGTAFGVIMIGAGAAILGFGVIANL
ncbi:hypothetical protein GCM10009841_30370 [Microlunatus panaciterrae]|uniref:Uncharacterized protein n=1 Tax=Microlunatus panaciterrae TaxID=400768 RepID=A0ABS2RGN3_9ACTN|nr:hypothetical protein [Microlunatus panaciterrae]MBM7797697.1 hypothetical protein [Microlunatus panaciterrae]